MIGPQLRKIVTNLAVGLVLAMSFVMPVSAALPGIVVSGSIVNTSTGRPMPGVTIITCTSVNPITDSNGHWQILVPTNTLYCARIGEGVPAGLVGPVTTGNNPEVRSATTYEYQQAGVNCYHNPVCTTDLKLWDRTYDGNVNFTFHNTPIRTPSPTPVHASTPALTPVPVAVVTPSATPLLSPAATTTPSATPQATTSTVSFASEDQIATAEVPAHNVPTGDVCKVAKTDSAHTVRGKSVVAGDYALTCTNQVGEPDSITVASVAWQFHLKGHLDKLHSPQAVIYNGSTSKIISSFYDHKTNILTFAASATAVVFVVGSATSYAWVNYLVIALGLLLVILFILYFPLRVHRRRSYQEYIRSKYYDL